MTSCKRGFVFEWFESVLERVKEIVLARYMFWYFRNVIQNGFTKCTRSLPQFIQHAPNSNHLPPVLTFVHDFLNLNQCDIQLVGWFLDSSWYTQKVQYPSQQDLFCGYRQILFSNKKSLQKCKMKRDLSPVSNAITIQRTLYFIVYDEKYKQE